MGIVAFTAVLLGCIAEIYRIKRLQAFYLTEAARYAQLEKHENNERSFELRHALMKKQVMEFMEQIDRVKGDRI